MTSPSAPAAAKSSDGNAVKAKPRRRCLLFVVDALAAQYIRSAIDDARLPQMAELLREGGQLVRCTSIFPSITPAATCTLATGAYPAQHHIEGSYWIDQSTGEMAYFGDDFQLVRQRGLHEYLIDFGERLNSQRLDAPTIFERVEAAGRSSGCVNFMWFHGDHVHRRSTPWGLRAFAGRLSGTTRGPKVLLLGDFVQTWPESMRPPAWNWWGLWHRYGFDDASSMARLLAMAEQDCLPDFTLAYFPNNDYESHTEGPRRALETAIRPFDEFLGRFVRTLGGWKKFREVYTLLIVGDHAQSESAQDPLQRDVRLDKILAGLGVAEATAAWGEGERLHICPNMRAASIYLREPDAALREEIVSRLLDETRVDQVVWQEFAAADSEAAGGATRYHVGTADRGRLSFSRAAPASEPKGVVRDDRGNSWSIEGDWRALDLTLDGDRPIGYGNYPNALERIAECFPPGSSPIWATARLGCEFRTDATSTHAGGSHGGLNWEDSDAALLTLGLEHSVPSRIASVDVLPLCLRALGIRETTGMEEVAGTGGPLGDAGARRGATHRAAE